MAAFQVIIEVNAGALALAISGMAADAQATSHANSVTQNQLVEVTKVDFLTMPKIVPTSISTFGITLGMTRQQATDGLKSFCRRCSIENGSREIDKLAASDNPACDRSKSFFALTLLGLSPKQ